ncbi:MAG: STN domain-containing protein, partial [Bacteroidales bacterium]|nr:STN domain-containing protein [Bacteroidales bacterium]
MEKLKMQIVIQCRKLVSLLVLTGLCFSAGADAPDGKKISVNLTNVSLEEVIWDIQKKSDFVFMYGTKVIENVKNLTVKFSNTEVSKILDHCLKQTGLKYEISGNAIVIKQTKEVQPEKI